MIRFSGVTKQFPNGNVALRGVSFSIEPRQLVFLTGHSGAGKTTLIKLLTLGERPSRGHIFINERNLTQIRGKNIAYYRRTIGVVHQDHKLLFDRRVRDNVALPLIVSNVEHSKIQRRVSAALEQVGLAGKENMYPMSLSGGEQQRVGIARAIVGRPPLIIADEPTGNLDHDLGTHIMNYFKMLAQHDTTVIVATHDRSHFESPRGEHYGHRILELREGMLLSDDGTRSSYV